MLTNTKETEIMLEIQQGNQERIQELLAACKAELSSVCYVNSFKFTPDWGEEDFYQDVLVKMWMEMPKFDPERSNFSTWFTLLSKTIYFKHHKKMKRDLDVEYLIEKNDNGGTTDRTETVKPHCSTENTIVKNEAWKRFYEELEKLPKMQRKAFKLCRMEGVKPAEAAKIMGCSAADISRWLYRGNEKMRCFIEKEELRSFLEPTL